MTNFDTRFLANGILAAWQERNLARFRNELDCASALDPAWAVTEDERERADLLSGIAEQMRRMVAQESMTDVTPYLGLLHHLAHAPACSSYAMLPR